MSPEQWAQVKKLFHAAAELPAEERAVFIQQHCNGDADLLRELQLLLESHQEAEHFIEKPALVSASEILPEGEDAWSGKTIGHYRVLREIGRGGMGMVLLAARDDDQFKKRVAIKVLRRGMDTEDILRRFRNERQIIASLEHPYIARLIDGGMTDDGLPYFVLDYIEGEPLDRYCDEHLLPTHERLQLFRKVCGAVHYAHQNLIVHRDLKPSNILVTSDGEPKLLDFGIAKLLNPELTAYTMAPTATQARLMTPDYASPEQIRGKNITTASDVYSLGVLLYRLLTGHAPYRFTGGSQREIERLVCESQPKRSERERRHRLSLRNRWAELMPSSQTLCGAG
jgi:serine/threonine protein kinase